LHLYIYTLFGDTYYASVFQLPATRKRLMTYIQGAKETT